MRNIQNHDVKIFTDNIETTAIEQIERLLTIPAFGGCKIRVMPDVHAGAGCVIGFTGDLGDKVTPVRDKNINKKVGNLANILYLYR